MTLGFDCLVSCCPVYFRCEEGRVGRIVGLSFHCHLETTFAMAFGLTSVVGHAEAVL